MKSAGICVFLIASTAAAQQPYRNWLNEDAAYIITANEELASLQLQTDRER